MNPFSPARVFLLPNERPVCRALSHHSLNEQIWFLKVVSLSLAMVAPWLWKLESERKPDGFSIFLAAPSITRPISKKKLAGSTGNSLGLASSGVAHYLALVCFVANLCLI